jgi:mannosyl-oligosaccharide glucosidase
MGSSQGSSDSSGDGGVSEAAQVEAVVEASKAALSNLLGSMGYFYGQSKVRSNHPSVSIFNSQKVPAS